VCVQCVCSVCGRGAKAWVYTVHCLIDAAQTSSLFNFSFSSSLIDLIVNSHRCSSSFSPSHHPRRGHRSSRPSTLGLSTVSSATIPYIHLLSISPPRPPSFLSHHHNVSARQPSSQSRPSLEQHLLLIGELPYFGGLPRVGRLIVVLVYDLPSTLDSVDSSTTTPFGPSSVRGSTLPRQVVPVMSLVALPPEVLCIIGRLLYSPFVYTIEREGMESVAPPFVPNTGERRVDLNSFLAFSSTCRTVRTATRPLVFTSIRLRNLEALSEVLDSDWKQHVRYVTAVPGYNQI